MVVQVYGFEWDFYAERVMPAFGRWLLDGHERAVQELYEQTRCAYEEQFLPQAMQRLRAWPRALAFLQTLPRGPYSRREYQKLCSAQQYTALSDRYLYKHAPQLYQHSNALRSIWGAIIESFCLPWTPGSSGSSGSIGATRQAQQSLSESAPHAKASAALEGVARGEIISLLVEAGLSELARDVETSESIERYEWDADLPLDDLPDERQEDAVREANFESSSHAVEARDESDAEIIVAAQGILIGQPSNLLHLRGWLATISVRAMALFEYLACGRRLMPFGFEAGEPFGAFCGYLTPEEVWQLAACLEDIIPPEQQAAEDDFLNFRYESYGIPPTFRLIDEVLPRNAADLLFAIRKASKEGLGLIASME
jgi:hypothetical protein